MAQERHGERKTDITLLLWRCIVHHPNRNSTMNPLFFSLIMLLWPYHPAYPQSGAVKQVFAGAQKASTTKYRVQPAQITLEMGFGQAMGSVSDRLAKLDYQRIHTIELVYSDYPKEYPHQQLNLQRFEQIGKLLPGIFEQPHIRWRIVRQTDCLTKQAASSLFHGFVISFEEYKQTLTVDYQKNTSVIKEAYLALPAEARQFLSMGDDTLAFDVLDRNIENWQNIALVSDWTASMYLHTTQVLRWHIMRQAESNIRQFVFFNDGDAKKQDEKIVGKTGGIYSIKAADYTEVIELMRQVKDKGDGGDLPENDIEALLAAQQQFPDAGEVVLIADNRSNIRDLALVPQLKRPVRIILARIVNDDIAYIKGVYVKIALATGGSLHTRYRDYTTKQELEQLIRDILAARQELRSHRRR